MLAPGVDMPRRLASFLASSLACTPEAHPTFAGEYDVTMADWTCRHDHPDGAPYHERAYFIEPLAIEEHDGSFEVVLPMPPCPIVGFVDARDLVLEAEDCVFDFPGSSVIGAFSIAYHDGEGIASWHDDELVITAEIGRRYTLVPDGLPEWWDVPGSCDAEYVLRPH